MKRLIWISCFTYLLIGLANIILGSVLTEFLHYYKKSYSAGGLIIAVQSFGFFIGVMSASILVKKVERKKLILLALLAIGISQLGFSLLLPWEICLVLAMLTGMGAGFTEPLIGSYIIDAVKSKKAVVFSRLEVFFGIGALVMPLCSGWLAATGYWRYSFMILFIYSLLLVIFWLKLSLQGVVSENAEEKKEQPERQPIHYGKTAYLPGFVLFFLFYVGMEVSIMNFLPSILIQKLGSAPFLATFSVTFFWTAMVIGRLFSGHLAERFTYSVYLAVCCIGAAIFMASLSFVTNLWAGYLIIGLTGLLMAGIFGISLVYATEMLKGSTDRNTSILIAAGGIGGIILPLITGGIMDHLAIELVTIFLAIVSLYMFFFILFTKKEVKEGM
ncbi:MFS transporter [Metabacillus sp. RGM 3146]|uniref:MFS transporter n=1 Tax=Metabacillus sp. RGM 3146 TaxID=3401092 RepID=UPI003B996E21